MSFRGVWYKNLTLLTKHEKQKGIESQGSFAKNVATFFEVLFQVVWNLHYNSLGSSCAHAPCLIRFS